MTTALITGASAGIGASFAQRLAGSGHDLVLVARHRDPLEDLAVRLRASHGIRTEILTADLADRADLERVAVRAAATGTDGTTAIDLLVNNAGFGSSREFLDVDIAAEERALDVMCRAVLVLSHAAARAMRERHRGAIINVSSVAGYAAMGHYSAIKAYVTTFSESLAGDLAGTGVRVQALCPGFTHTEFHARAEINMSRLPEALWLNSDDVVTASLRDLRNGRVVCVPGAAYQTLVTALQHLPRGLVRRVSGELAERRRVASTPPAPPRQ